MNSAGDKTMTTKRNRKTSKRFAPASWQWDPSQLGSDRRIQVWSASGTLTTLVSIQEAIEMVREGAYFLGSSAHICQVHDQIDPVNRPA